MSITANASPSEMNSPFYKANEEFVLGLEKYVSKRGGKVTGRYNAWSYHVKGKIDLPRPWILQYKKSTITSQGNIFLSSEYQSLLVLSKWNTVVKTGPGTEFVIRRKRKRDLLFRLFNRHLHKSGISGKYLIRSSGGNPLISCLTELLKLQFESGEVYRIEHRKNRLHIEMRTKEHHFRTFEEVVKAIEDFS